MNRIAPVSVAWWRRALVVCGAVVVISLVGAVPGSAHVAKTQDYRTTIDSISPEGLPIDVRVTDGDQIRFENLGDEDLLICGYTPECDEYARIGPKGVFVNTNSKAYFANLDANKVQAVPDDAGEGAPKWKRVRREPAFFAYHDHRTHWMGGKTLPPGVDTSDPDAQRVNDFTLTFRYGDRDGTVKWHLDYVGGQTWWQRYGEYGLTGAAIVAMLVVFVLDARRRRRDRAGGASNDAA